MVYEHKPKYSIDIIHCQHHSKFWAEPYYIYIYIIYIYISIIIAFIVLYLYLYYIYIIIAFIVDLIHMYLYNRNTINWEATNKETVTSPSLGDAQVQEHFLGCRWHFITIAHVCLRLKGQESAGDSVVKF